MLSHEIQCSKLYTFKSVFGLAIESRDLVLCTYLVISLQSPDTRSIVILFGVSNHRHKRDIVMSQIHEMIYGNGHGRFKIVIYKIHPVIVFAAPDHYKGQILPAQYVHAPIIHSDFHEDYTIALIGAIKIQK